MSGNGNSDLEEQALAEAFKGARIGYSQLSGEDGLLTKAGPVTQSLLHRMISADIEHIENELKTANWGSFDEADNAVDAYCECVALGLDPLPVKLTLIARNAGQKGDLRRNILDALTHSTFTTNYQRDKNAARKSKDSPLSP